MSDEGVPRRGRRSGGAHARAGTLPPAEPDAAAPAGLELRWPGKYDAEGRRTPVPRPGATLVRRVAHGPSVPATAPDDGWRNRLVEGDNLLALDALVREHAGTVDLVYIDPPFATGSRFDVVTPVGPSDAPGGPRQLRRPAYTDAWPGGPAGLVAMLDPRLRLVHELLAPHGSLYVHVDPTVGHAVKLLLDEVFGPACFQREIVWRVGWVSGFKTRAHNWIRNHDLVLFYVKDPRRFTFNKRYVPHPPGYLRRDGSPPRGRGVPLDDVWNAGEAELSLRGRDSLDSIQIKSFSTEKTGYATQKNESLLRRIVEASSNPGDLVADVFCGSGTTLAVAQALGRRFIGCDAGRAAIQIACGRLLRGERARGFEVLEVRGSEPAAAHVEARLRAGWAALTGRPLGALRMLATATERDVGEGEAVRARREGVDAVAAWRWSVAASVEDEGDAVAVGERWPPARRVGRGRPAPVQLVLPRELRDAAATPPPAAIVVERARLRVRLCGLSSGRVAVELVDLAQPSPELLPAELRDPPLGPLALVERWSVTWDERDGTTDVVLARAGRERVLPTRSPAHAYAGRAATLVVRVEDALGREHRLWCRLACARGRWQVAQARAETDG
jgi:DNA modification methylase